MTTPYHPPLKRSVEIAGHKTSISLEPLYWELLKQAASAEGLPINALSRGSMPSEFRPLRRPALRGRCGSGWWPGSRGGSPEPGVLPASFRPAQRHPPQGSSTARPVAT